MLACRVQYVENTGIGIAARANSARRKATSNSALWPHHHHPLQRRPDPHGEIREPRGAGEVRIGDPVHVGGAGGPIRLEAADPLIDRVAVLVGPHDRELDDPLPIGIETGGLHVDHGEAWGCAGRSPSRAAHDPATESPKWASSAEPT